MKPKFSFLPLSEGLTLRKLVYSIKHVGYVVKEFNLILTSTCVKDLRKCKKKYF
jgi:hypothetical protein